MRWAGQQVNDAGASEVPGLVRLSSRIRSVQTPEFEGITFHEVLAKSALNRVPESSRMLPGAWTINPYRGCSHACLYCYARPTHRYLELDAGDDFDRQIVVKVNVAEVLARELSSGKARPDRVALGTNTDPYQRAEGRYRLMPEIISALSEAGVGFSVLTKGTLLRRDLPLLREASRRVDVSVALSVAILDDRLQQSLEPGTPSAAARLATVRQVRDHGLSCAVFLAPILPFLTDSTEQLDEALDRIRAAGATAVMFTALRLAPGVKEGFFGWVAQEHPEQLEGYRRLYASGQHAPESYRRALHARMQVLMRRHDLQDLSGVETGPTTAERFSLRRAGSAGSSAPRGVLAGFGADSVGGEQPLLF